MAPKKSTCPLAKQVHAKNLGKATQEALPFPWQENEGTPVSVLGANGSDALEQKRRCGMRASVAAYVQLLRHVLLRRPSGQTTPTV